MVTEELKEIKDGFSEFKVVAVQAEVGQLAEWVLEAAREETAAHGVERHLFAELLKVGRVLLGGFLQAAGNGDRGERIELEGGRVWKRFAGEHVRELLTVFGRFTISRCVSGRAERQAIELAPTDQTLQLPESEVSYVLQEWDQLLGIEQAWGRSVEIIQTILGVRQSVDTLERMSRQMARSGPAFREQPPAPDPQLEGEVLIVTEDNKGVPMVRPATLRRRDRTSPRVRSGTRNRWPASAACTRWIVTCARPRNSWPHCSATTTARAAPCRRLNKNATGPS